MKKSFDTLLQLNDERNENLKINENGHIQVKNLSAYWIPELTAVEIIAGAVYTVTGSYDGTESFLSKLERIAANNSAEKLEDSE